MADTDNITWLMNWYSAQCNDDWEHQYGVHIDTLDNPGWLIDIDLSETALETQIYSTVDNLKADASWWYCTVEKNQWRARCGPNDLTTVIGLFRDWAESVEPST